MPLLRALLASVVGAGVLSMAGCGESGPTLYPVRGTVKVGGKPAAEAIVFLHRVGRSAPDEPVPYGRAGADGAFVVTSRKPGDGAQAGEYVLTVVWPDMSKPEDSNGMRPDALRGTYDKPAQSKFKVTVEARDNELAALDLVLPPPPRAPERKETPQERAAKGDK